MLVLHEFEEMEYKADRQDDGLLDRHGDVAAVLRAAEAGGAAGGFEETGFGVMDYNAQLKLQAFLDGELPEAEASEVANWLARDREAAALLEELRNTRSALAGFEAEVRLPESREFFWSKIEREIQRLETPAPKPAPVPLLGPVPPVAGSRFRGRGGLDRRGGAHPADRPRWAARPRPRSRPRWPTRGRSLTAIIPPARLWSGSRIPPITRLRMNDEMGTVE